MCGVVEAAIIKAEPGTSPLSIPISGANLSSFTLNAGTATFSLPAGTANISTLCLPSGQPLTLTSSEATLLLQSNQHIFHHSGSSPPTLSIQEATNLSIPSSPSQTMQVGTPPAILSSESPPTISMPSNSPHTISFPSNSSPLPYTLSLTVPSSTPPTLSLSGVTTPLSLSALLPLHPLPPTHGPLLPARSPLLSISEVTNTLLDHNQ